MPCDHQQAELRAAAIKEWDIQRRPYEQGLTAFIEQQIRKDIINGSTGS